jgi:hypothetical protein
MNLIPSDEEIDKKEERKEEIKEEANKEEKKEKYSEIENLITKKERQEKLHLQEILKKLENNLSKTKDNTIPEAYEDYLNNEDITKRNIKEGTNECLMIFMFYFIAPLFGIIFLIGIFQIISLHKSLFNLLKCSMKDYYFCQIKHDCILNEIKEKPEYNFYKYFYDSSNNETIDFKLTMITAIFGEMLLKSRGFRISSFVLGLINIGCMFWLYNFDTSFKESDFEYFSIIKVVNILAFYLLLLIGIGSSALLSQKILIDSHLKYKEYIIKKKEKICRKIRI